MPLSSVRPIDRRRQGALRGRASSGCAGGPSGQRWPHGVDAAYGWSFSRWFDARCWGPWWGETVPEVPRCLPITGWPPWGPCHVCVVLCRLILAAVLPWFLEGPPAVMVPFSCR